MFKWGPGIRRLMLLVAASIGPAERVLASPPAVVTAGKDATALVVLPSKQGFGSAFCVNDAGFVVTCAHVVSDQPKDKSIELVLNAGDDGERVVNAKVVRINKDADVALLKIISPAKLKWLDLGDATGLVETQSITAFGFPLGNLLAVEKQKYPSISVNVGRVTALRKSAGKLEVIQVDAQLNPGNSGGPVLDEAGKVIGIVAAGVPGSGINFVIPVTAIKSLLDAPQLNITPGEIAYAKRHDTISFVIHVVTFGKPLPVDAEVELTLGEGTTSRHLMATPGSAGTFTVSAPPLPPAAAAKVPVSLIFDGGSLESAAEDISITIGGRKIALHDVRTISRKNQSFSIVTRADQTVAGSAIDPPKLALEVAGAPLTIDFAKIQELTTSVAPADAGAVAYTITAKSKGAVLATEHGTIDFTALPANVSVASSATSKPAVAGPEGLQEIGSFAAPGNVQQICYSPLHGMLFVRNTASTITSLNSETGETINSQESKRKFTDMDLSPDQSALFAADYGGTNVGYGAPKDSSYVHRFNLLTGKWEVRDAPKIAFLVRGVETDTFLLLEDDQWIALSLNRWNRAGPGIKELARQGAGYHGQMAFDPRTGRVIHASEGISSHEVNVLRVQRDAIKDAKESAGHDNGEGSAVLSPDGKNFYYGRVQLDAMDVTHERITFPERIYGATATLAFGKERYYDAKSGDEIAELGFKDPIFCVSRDGTQVWIFDAKSETLHHYKTVPRSGSSPITATAAPDDAPEKSERTPAKPKRKK